MSNINPEITNDEVIPSVESDLFMGNENRRFAVGLLAIGNQVLPGREEVFDGYLRLRANVYAAQTNMISPELVHEDGTETDEDDSRSVHFAVVENAMDSNRVVATMRLIIKSHEDSRPLPIEEFFGEAFKNPAPMGSTEVSRYICRHEDIKIQNKLKWPLYTAALSYALTHDLKPSFGVVEEPLEKSLVKSAIPVERIACPKYVEEYAADNLALKIDTEKLAENMGLTREAAQLILSQQTELVYFGEAVNKPETALPA